jgi:hypothetical protein
MVVPMSYFSRGGDFVEVLYEGGMVGGVGSDDLLVSRPVHVVSSLVAPLEAVCDIIEIPWQCCCFPYAGFVVTGDGFAVDEKLCLGGREEWSDWSGEYAVHPLVFSCLIVGLAIQLCC